MRTIRTETMTLDEARAAITAASAYLKATRHDGPTREAYDALELAVEALYAEVTAIYAERDCVGCHDAPAEEGSRHCEGCRRDPSQRDDYKAQKEDDDEMRAEWARCP